MKSETRAYINIAALVLVLLINYLSNAIPFNNLTQAEINFELYPVLFTPASYVFSIWGLIYVLLIGFVVYQALPKYRDNPYNEAVGVLFALTSLLNIFWILAWHYLQIPLSMLIMVLLLFVLLVIYFRVKNESARASLLDKIFVKLSFRLYLAWICAAVLANLNVMLYHFGWLGTGFGGALFTALMIILGAAVALYLFYVWSDYVFPLVFAWAFIGIGVRHGSEEILVTAIAWIAAAALLFLMGWISRSREMPIWGD